MGGAGELHLPVVPAPGRRSPRQLPGISTPPAPAVSRQEKAGLGFSTGTGLQRTRFRCEVSHTDTTPAENGTSLVTQEWGFQATAVLAAAPRRC